MSDQNVTTTTTVEPQRSATRAAAWTHAESRAAESTPGASTRFTTPGATASRDTQETPTSSADHVSLEY